MRPVRLTCLTTAIALFGLHCPVSAQEQTGTASDPVARQGWGTIKGRVVFAGATIPKQRVLIAKGDTKSAKSEFCAKMDILSDELVVDTKNRGIRWVVVYVIKPRAIHPDLAKPVGDAEIGITDCMVQPHVLAYREGQRLLVSISDPEGHNMMFQGIRNPEESRRVPPASNGQKSSVVGPEFKAERNPITLLGCNVHAWMKGYVFVFDHPYFAVTDENGEFEMRNVPAGELKLVHWQEKCGYGAGGRGGMQIEVKANETTDLGELKLDLLKE